MYIPEDFVETNAAAIDALIEAHSFATIVNSQGSVPLASHVPIIYERQAGKLWAHIARANPQWRLWEAGQETLVIFQGPHAYISPAWYEKSDVPTWNYVSAHVYGKPTICTEAELEQLLERLVDKHESKRAKPWRYQVDETYRRHLLREIVGVAIPMERIEAKSKLSQNRSAADQSRVAAALMASNWPEERALGELMAARGRAGAAGD